MTAESPSLAGLLAACRYLTEDDRKVDTTLRTTPERTIEDRVLAAAKAAVLIGFPLIPMLVYLSGTHPGLGGGSTGSAEQISNLAAQADRWTGVHLAFSVGGFFGLAAVLVIRSEVAKKAPELWTDAAAALAVIGGVIFTGTVLMEVSVIPALARACAESPGCRVPGNVIFTDALADQGWRVLPGLTAGGRTLMFGLALLAVLGFVFGGLRNWEAAGLFGGSLIEFGANTGLHQWGNFQPAYGMPGLAAVAILIAGCGIAFRLVMGDRRTALEALGPAVTQEPGPAPEKASQEPDIP
jgi:hypothetical protein